LLLLPRHVGRRMATSWSAAARATASRAFVSVARRQLGPGALDPPAAGRGGHAPSAPIGDRGHGRRLRAVGRLSRRFVAGSRGLAVSLVGARLWVPRLDPRWVSAHAWRGVAAALPRRARAAVASTAGPPPYGDSRRGRQWRRSWR